MRICLWVVAFTTLALGVFGGFVQAAKLGDALKGIEYAAGASSALYSDAERMAFELKSDLHNYLSIGCFLLGSVGFFVFAWMAEVYSVARLLKKSILNDQN